jgi:polysaccharide export outer membrane protein
VVIPTLTEEAREDYDRSLVARSTLAQRQINVRFLNYASGTGGSVGNIVLNNGSNFVDAIAVISPSLGEAEIGSIALIRFDVQQGKAITQELNGKQAFMGDTSQNPMLENNDVIVIGRNLITRITYFFNTFTQPFRDVLGFLLFFDSLSNAASDLFRPTGNSQSNN